MPISGHLAVWGCILAFVPARLAAQSDNPIADLSLDSDDAVNVVYAVYGGIANSQVHYQNVTDKVSALLSKGTFPVDEATVLGAQGTKERQSLLVVYNYQQRSYFYNIVEGSGMLSFDKLKLEAKAHPSHDAELPAVSGPDTDFRVIFATYGINDVFWNETELVKKLLRDEPEGFLAHEDVMGGDPHFGWQKAFVVVFDDASGRHFYAQANNGPAINKIVLENAATGN
jgi:hypothetical protein